MSGTGEARGGHRVGRRAGRRGATPPAIGDSRAVRRAGRTASGAGRVLVAAYAVFAVAATSRAGFQVATKLDEAPLAYGLSALAAGVYVLATVGLAVDRPWARRLAWAAVSVEATGVLTVGTFSLLRPELFPDATVWSSFGLGYLLVPLVLPAVGLWWLRRTSAEPAPGEPAPRPSPPR